MGLEPEYTHFSKNSAFSTSSAKALIYKDLTLFKIMYIFHLSISKYIIFYNYATRKPKNDSIFVKV